MTFTLQLLSRTAEQSSPSILGFVRLMLSASTFEKEFRNTVIATIMVAILLSLAAIVMINRLISRLVVRPAMVLHGSIAQLSDGCIPEDLGLAGKSTHEIRAFAGEISRVCKTVKENEAKLIASDQRIRSLFERVEHAIFRIDAKGRISEANSRFRWMFGGVIERCDIKIGDISSANVSAARQLTKQCTSRTGPFPGPERRPSSRSPCMQIRTAKEISRVLADTSSISLTRSGWKNG